MSEDYTNKLTRVFYQDSYLREEIFNAAEDKLMGRPSNLTELIREALDNPRITPAQAQDALNGAYRQLQEAKKWTTQYAMIEE